MRGGKRPFSPLDLFQNGLYSGFYYDFSKTDRTFQESTGQTIADDDAEVVGLALEESQWAGKTLAQLLSSLPNQITNADNEAALMTAAYGAVSTTRGAVAQSSDRGFSGTMSAKFTADATTGAHYILIAAGAVPGNKTLFIRAKVYVPTGSISAARMIDSGDGSWVTANLTTKDAWVTLNGIRGQKGSAWALGLGNNASETISGQTFYIDDLEIYEIPGNHGLQATGAARPTRKTGGFLRFDGSDDNLLTTLNPSLALTMAFKGVPVTNNACVMGGQPGTSNRCGLFINSAGQIGAGVGTQSSATILGGSDVRNTLGVGAVAFDGATVRLYWNGVEIYNDAQAGAPSTTIPIRLGCLNNNGTAGTFSQVDKYKALAINRALSASEILALTNFWGTT